MITFSEVAHIYLKERGFEPFECETENEARDRAKELIGAQKWPCYFFKTDTTGEKGYEEFFTENEDLDMDRFKTVGIIRNKLVFDDEKLDSFLNGIRLLRKQATWNKLDILDLFTALIPDFYHKEMGKYLDERM